MSLKKMEKLAAFYCWGKLIVAEGWSPVLKLLGILIIPMQVEGAEHAQQLYLLNLTT